jgi:Flp pilus assembly protein TadD
MSEASKINDPAAPSSPSVSSAGEIPGMKGSISLASENRPAGMNDRWLVLGVCIFLAAIIWVVFGQMLRYGFVSFDDNLYVYENPVVQKGLTWEGFCWALTYGQIGHWHPLTWLSHMLDCQLYGLNAGGHHLTNVLLHTASAILLFLVLRRMTGCLWRSAFVAAVFAIHPLHVESVAWIAERKDVLSAFFFMLTLGAYARYVQKQSKVESRESGGGNGSLALDPRLWTLDYGLVVLFFALGLLSKNMLVTTPFVLLLLDYWPLGRMAGDRWRVTNEKKAGPHSVKPSTLNPQFSTLLCEKWPLLVLTVGSCVATALVPEKLTVTRLSFGLRLENAVMSYVTYLWQMIHPLGLACLYPNPTHYLPVWQVAGAVGLLLAISGAAWAFRKTQPWLVVGWLWYLGMMIPVIGMVQIAHYAHADRYTYLPQIGLYVLLTWTVADLCAGWRYRRVVLVVVAAVILAALITYAHEQTSYWRNGELLWTHALDCTSDNALAHYNLGDALLKKGSLDEAIIHYQKALQINPGYAEAHNNLGVTLFQKGSVDEAIAQYQKALQIKPDNAEARNNLGNALLLRGKVDEAIAQCQKALQMNPDNAEALNNLAWLLATSPDAHIRNGVQAVQHAERACELTHYWEILPIGTLAAAYAEAGRFDNAIATAQKACALASKSGEPDLLEKNQKLLALYRTHQPYHETAEKFVPAAP